MRPLWTLTLITLTAAGTALHVAGRAPESDGVANHFAEGIKGVVAPSAASCRAAPAVVAASAFGIGPARFEQNLGQAPAESLWVRRGPGHATYVLRDGFATMVRPRDGRAGPGAVPPATVGHVVRFRFAGATPSAAAEGEAPLGSRTHHYLGADASTWVRDLPDHERVRVRNVWPGIDVMYRGSDGRLTYDFLVAPGADASRIGFDVEGADDLRIDARGDLVIGAGVAEIRHRRPVAYEESDEGRTEIAGRFVLHGGRRVGLQVEGRCVDRALVIDPTEEVRLRLGGTGLEDGTAVAAAPPGVTSPYLFAVGGWIYALPRDVPVTGGPLGRSTFAGAATAFVVAFADERTVAWTAILDSTGDDSLTFLRTAADGIHAVGTTDQAASFPRVNPAQTTGLGGYDGTYFKILPDGSALAFCGPFGGTSNDLFTGLALATDPLTGATTAAYVAGLTYSTDVPLVGTSLGGTDGMLVRFDAAGAAVAGRRVGGSDDDVSGQGLVEVAGDDVFAGFSISSTDAPTTAGVLHPTKSSANLVGGYLPLYDGNLTTLHAATYWVSDVDHVIVTCLATDARNQPSPPPTPSSTGLRLGAAMYVIDDGCPTSTNAPQRSSNGGRESYAFVFPAEIASYANLFVVELFGVLTRFGGPTDDTPRGLLFTGTPTDPRLVLTGTTGGVDPVGGGVAAPGGGDVFLAELSGPVDALEWGLVTNIGAFALQNQGAIHYVANRLFSVGRFLDALDDGRVLVLGQTYSPTDSWEGRDVIGPGGGGRDIFVQSVTSTAAVVPAPVVEVQFTSGRIADSAEDDRFFLEAGARFGLGAFDDLDPGDIEPTGWFVAEQWLEDAVDDAEPVADWDLPPSGYQAGLWDYDRSAQSKLRQSAFRAPDKSPSGSRFDAVVDTSRGTVSVKFRGDNPGFTPQEGPIRFTMRLGDRAGAVERRIVRRGKRLAFAAPYTGVRPDLVLGAAAGVVGQPLTITARLRNYDDSAATHHVEIRAGSAVLASQDLVVPARRAVVRVPASASLLVDWTPDRAGREKLELLVDGRRVKRIKVRVTEE